MTCRLLQFRRGWIIFAILLLLVAVPSIAQTETEPAPVPEMASPESDEPLASVRDDTAEGGPVDLEEPAPSESAEGATEVSGQSDSIALFYLRRCSGCHTIGRGDLDGPDLLPSTRWPREDLEAAVRRMEKNVGPMTEEQVGGLVELLGDETLQQRLEAAASRRVAELAAELDPGSPRTGERLFFGSMRLRNGAVACFACHSVSGRGGNMAVDLTLAHQRLGASSLLSATEAPSFPMMKAAYAPRPVTAQEAVHIVAFLEAASGDAQAEGVVAPPSESVRTFHGAAGGLVLLTLGSIVFAVRSRRAGSRSRLVRESFRR